jgi:bloom syndrome protein
MFNYHPFRLFGYWVIIYLSGAGEGGQFFITVESCGDDFIAALADATETSDDWDDLNAIETEACGNLNEMMMRKGVTDEKGVDVNTPLFKRADSSSQHTPSGLKASSYVSDDSDFDDSFGVHKKARSTNSKAQTRSSTKSTVSQLS